MNRRWLSLGADAPHRHGLSPCPDPAPNTRFAPPPTISRNPPLSRENRPNPSPLRAHPRHRLSERRARLAGAAESASDRARVMTRLRTGDVGAARQVFVTDINMSRVGDTFNLPEAGFWPASRYFFAT